jgi:hypothetical protein
MLESRNVSATLSGETLRAATDRGCPQGGVLSPLLWSLVVDDLLWELNSNGYYTVGYADDIAYTLCQRSYKQPFAQSKSNAKRQVCLSIQIRR